MAIVKKLEVCIATNNKKKLAEMKILLGDFFEIKTLKEIGCFEEIEESGRTFLENSKIKADFIHQKYGLNVIADDSGLEVNALNFEPGVFSARYAGEPSNDEANIDKLLQKMQNIQDRRAQFKTVISLILDNQFHYFEGIVLGEIAETRLGTNGFGYDPVFIPLGYTQSFAELPSETKNKISHRALALKQMLAFIVK